MSPDAKPAPALFIEVIVRGLVFAALLAGIVGIIAKHVRDKSRRPAVQRSLKTHKLKSIPLDETHAKELEAALAHHWILDFPGVAPERLVRWAATGSIDGVSLTALEFEFNFDEILRYSVVSIPVPDWPHLEIRPESFLERIKDALGVKDIQVADQAFNQRFHITTDDTDFALRILSNNVQWLMSTWETDVCLLIRKRRLWVYQHRHLEPGDWDVLINRAILLRKALPSELDAPKAL